MVLALFTIGLTSPCMLKSRPNYFLVVDVDIFVDVRCHLNTTVQKWLLVSSSNKIVQHEQGAAAN